jgi:2-methylfumaryl-CoA isomerase
MAMGLHAAIGILAAERHRNTTGMGSLVRLALSDVAFAMVGNLGRIAQAQVGQAADSKDDNYLYGAFGHDFATRDGRRVMVVALTERQWQALVQATGISDAVSAMQAETGLDLDTEGGRYAARDRIASLLRPWFAARTLAEVRRAFEQSGVSWGPYQTFRQLVEEDPRCSPANPMFSEVLHPGLGTFLTPGSPLDFSTEPRLPTSPAPVLGEHTDEILSDLLGLAEHQIAALHDRSVVAGPVQPK